MHVHVYTLCVYIYIFKLCIAWHRKLELPTQHGVLQSSEQLDPWMGLRLFQIKKKGGKTSQNMFFSIETFVNLRHFLFTRWSANVFGGSWIPAKSDHWLMHCRGQVFRLVVSKSFCDPSSWSWSQWKILERNLNLETTNTLDIEGHWPANGWECPRLSKVCPWPTVVQPHILPVDLSWCRLWIFVDLMATFQGTLGHEFGRCSNRYMIWHMTKVFSLGWMMPIQSRSSNLEIKSCLLSWLQMKNSSTPYHLTQRIGLFGNIPPHTLMKWPATQPTLNLWSAKPHNIGFNGTQ